jgi:hypothetical protein
MRERVDRGGKQRQDGKSLAVFARRASVCACVWWWVVRARRGGVVEGVHKFGDASLPERRCTGQAQARWLSGRPQPALSITTTHPSK